MFILRSSKDKLTCMRQLSRVRPNTKDFLNTWKIHFSSSSKEIFKLFNLIKIVYEFFYLKKLFCKLINTNIHMVGFYAFDIVQIFRSDLPLFLKVHVLLWYY